MMKSIKEIKCLARQALHGNLSSFIMLFLCGYFVESLIVSLPTSFLAVPKNIPLYLSQILLTILLEAMGSMVMLGVYRGALQLIRGQQFRMSDLFFAFRNQGDHFLALELIFTAINTVTSIPGFVFMWIGNASNMHFLTYSLVSSIFTGVSVILTFLVTLTLSMSEFLMLDDPSMTAGEALKYSMELMRGHIGHYFLLILSFLGFLILGLASAMIGFLWVMPYIIVSQALFYENLCDLKDAEYQAYE